MTVLLEHEASIPAIPILERRCSWLKCRSDIQVDWECQRNVDACKVTTSSSDAVRVRRISFTSSKRRRQIKEFAQRLDEWHSITPHPNIISLLSIGTTEDASSILFISPWVGHGQNIMQYIREHPDHNRLESALEIAEGVKYLHDPQKGWDAPIFVHGDIRGENVFVRPDGSCYLGEFALTCVDPVKMDPTMPAALQYSRWAAPELLNPKAFASYPTDRGSFADGTLRPCNDIYSLASTIFEILTGEAPYFQYSHDVFVTADVLRGVLPEPRNPEEAAEAGLDEDIQKLLTSMWRYSPLDRIGIIAICKVLKKPSAINNRRPQRLAPVFAATAAATARRLYA
ncbi:hypothetical protein ONZ45_g8870 [Pleurotus djamor]|nr:hypothetical protein ONZ45_g8870 [Pleurotus djamor]